MTNTEPSVSIARFSAARAEQQEKIADTNRASAELELARGLLFRGRAQADAGYNADAESNYRRAKEILARNGGALLPASLALADL